MGIAQILVVEDEMITANDIKNSLEKAGYQVPAIVSTGEDAIKKTEEFKPDIVLMDIKLEGKMDGIDAAEIIQSNFNIPVIYLTAYSDKKTVERVKTTQPQGYILKEPFGFLHKPFDENVLFTAIDIILKRNNDDNISKDHDKWYASLLKSISDGVIATDAKGSINFMNSSAEKLTGWKEEESTGKQLIKVFTALKKKPEVSSEVTLKDIVMGKVILKSKNGVKTPIEGTLAPVKNEKGDPDGLILIFKSIESKE